MRITFVYDLVHPYTVGGAERRIFEIARRLAGRHEVHQVGLKFWEGPRSFLTAEGIHLHGLALPPGSLYDASGRRRTLEPPWFGAALLRFPGLFGADVVDCSSFPYFGVYAARLHALLGRARLVTTWHEYWGEYWRRYSPRLARLGSLVERGAARLSGHLVCVSEHTRERLVQAGVPASRTDVIPNGVDLASIAATPEGPPGAEVLFVGRLIDEKRADLVLRALAAEPLRGAKTARAAIVGTGPARGRLQALAAELGLTERVSFTSWLPQPELYQAIRAARVLVLPSEREGFAMIVLEAMACGTPVVVTRGTQSAASELVVDGETGRVVDPDPAAIAAALAGLLGSGEPGRRLGEAGRRRAAAYDWEPLSRRTESLYERLSGG